VTIIKSLKNTLKHCGLVVGSERCFNISMLDNPLYQQILRAWWAAVISLTLLLSRVIAAQGRKESIQNTLTVLVIPSCCRSALRPPAAGCSWEGTAQTVPRTVELQRGLQATVLHSSDVPKLLSPNKETVCPFSRYCMYSARHFISASPKLTVPGLGGFFTASITDPPYCL